MQPFIVKMFWLHTANLSVFVWSTFQPKWWHPCQVLSYVNPEVDHVSTIHYIASWCIWPHTEHNLNSMSGQNNTEAITTHSLFPFSSLSLSLFIFFFWLRKLLSLVEILSLKPKKKKLKKKKKIKGKTHCAEEEKRYLKIKELMKTWHHTTHAGCSGIDATPAGWGYNRCSLNI